MALPRRVLALDRDAAAALLRALSGHTSRRRRGRVICRGSAAFSTRYADWLWPTRWVGTYLHAPPQPTTRTHGAQLLGYCGWAGRACSVCVEPPAASQPARSCRMAPLPLFQQSCHPCGAAHWSETALRARRVKTFCWARLVWKLRGAVGATHLWLLAEEALPHLCCPALLLTAKLGSWEGTAMTASPHASRARD